MIEHVLQFLVTHVVPLGAIGVFLASIIEEVIAPIPSALVLTLSGFLLVKGSWFSGEFFSSLFFSVVLPGALGVALGSSFVYGVCYYFGEKVIVKFGKYFGISWQEVVELQQKFAAKKVDEYGLFILRAIPIIPSVVVSAFAGVIRFNFRSYLIISFLGSLPRVVILALIGFAAGDIYTKYAAEISRYENYVLVVLVVAAFVFFQYKLRRKKSL